MNACLLIASLVLAGAPDETRAVDANPAAIEAMILPLRITASPGQTVGPAQAAVEQVIAEAYARHSGQRTLSPQELQATLSQSVRDQLLGCTDPSCMVEIAGALDAQWAIVLLLDVAPGLWTLRGSLWARAQSQPVRRASVRARSLAALLDSLDSVGRALAGAAQVDPNDAGLGERLGTDAAGVERLKEALRQQPDAELASVWTDVIIAHNRRGPVLALASGAAFAAAAVLLTVGALSHAVLNGLALYALPTGVSAPMVSGGASVVVPVLLFSTAFAASVVGLALVAVDAWNPGRIKALKTGCCRDEARIRAAASAGLARRLGTVLSAGSVAAVLASIALAGAAYIVTYVGMLTVLGGQVPWPEVYPDVKTARLPVLATLVWMNLSPLILGVLVLPLSAAALAGTLVLQWGAYAPVVDEAPVVAVPAPSNAGK